MIIAVVIIVAVTTAVVATSAVTTVDPIRVPILTITALPVRPDSCHAGTKMTAVATSAATPTGPPDGEGPIPASGLPRPVSLSGLPSRAETGPADRIPVGPVPSGLRGARAGHLVNARRLVKNRTLIARNAGRKANHGAMTTAAIADRPTTAPGATGRGITTAQVASVREPSLRGVSGGMMIDAIPALVMVIAQSGLLPAHAIFQIKEELTTGIAPTTTGAVNRLATVLSVPSESLAISPRLVRAVRAEMHRDPALVRKVVVRHRLPASPCLRVAVALTRRMGVRPIMIWTGSRRMRPSGFRARFGRKTGKPFA